MSHGATSGRRYRQIGRWSDGGVIVTFAHRATGQLSTVHEPDVSKRAALRRACARFDPDEWRVATVSTPQSIYDDITFGRSLIDPVSDGARGRVRERSGFRYSPQFSEGGTRGPESSLCGAAGCKAWL